MIKLSGWIGLLLVLLTGVAPAQTNLTEISVLTRAEACRIALQNHPSLDEALWRVRQAQSRIGQSQARYWPVLTLAGGASRVDPADAVYFTSAALPVGAGGSSGGFSTEPENWYQAGAQATWVLFDGFARRAAVAAARYSASGAEASLREAKRQILSAVVAAYLNVQSAREQQRIAAEDTAFNERLLHDAEASLTAGRGALSDVLNFRVRSNAARSTVIFAKRQQRIARVGLAVLMGVPTAELPKKLELAELTEPTAEDRLLPSVTNVMHQILTQRPDIERGMTEVSRSLQAVKGAQAGYYPTLAFSGSYDARRPEDMSFDGDDFAASAGVVLSFDIFAGGLHRSRVREARAGLEVARAGLVRVQLAAIGEARNAVEKLRAAVEYLELQNQNVECARQNRDLIAKAYAVGQMPLVRMNEAQKDLVAAQVRRTQAVISLRQARNDLDTATGAILQIAKSGGSEDSQAASVGQ